MNAQMKAVLKEGEAATSPTQTVYSELHGAYDYFNERLFDGKLPPCIISIQRHKGALGMFSQNRFVDRAQPDQYAHELSLHPGYFAIRRPKEILSTLVHEMVHLQRSLSAKEQKTTRGYHDKEWGTLMEAVGLIPSNTGKPGGKKLGFRMTHYIAKDGPFDIAAQGLMDSGWSVTWLDRVIERDDLSMEDGRVYLPSDGDEPSRGSLAPTPTQDEPEGFEPPPQEPSPDDDQLPPELAKTLMPRSESKSGKRTKYACTRCDFNVWGKANLPIICGACEQPYTVVTNASSDEN